MSESIFPSPSQVELGKEDNKIEKCREQACLFPTLILLKRFNHRVNPMVDYIDRKLLYYLNYVDY